MYRAAGIVRLAAAFAFIVGGLGVGACASEGPPHISVGTIFDASPNCGGADGAPDAADPHADAGAATDAPVIDAPAAAIPSFSRSCEPGRLRPATLGRPGTVTAKVILISVDGLRPDAIFHAPAPNLQALACKGAYSWRARTIHPSITLPSHASMVSGFPPEQHGIFHNDLQPGYINVPTVLSAAKQAGRKVVLVVGKEKMIQLVPPGSYDVFVWTPDLDEDVIDKAVEEVAAGFDLMFVHLPMVDLTGHAQGWMSEAYLRQVSATDVALGRLLAVRRPRPPSSSPPTTAAPATSTGRGCPRTCTSPGSSRAPASGRPGRSARTFTPSTPPPPSPTCWVCTWCPRLRARRSWSPGHYPGPAGAASQSTRLGRATIAASRQATSPRMAMAPKPCRARLRAASSEP